MSTEPPSKYRLVMPFVAVTSKGGRYDDESYAAGWELGVLDTRLKSEKPEHLTVTIHTANAEQADLVAMKNGYACTVTEHDETWSTAQLTKAVTR